MSARRCKTVEVNNGYQHRDHRSKKGRKINNPQDTLSKRLSRKRFEKRESRYLRKLIKSIVS